MPKPTKNRSVVEGPAERTLFNGLAKESFDLFSRALETDGADPDATERSGGMLYSALEKAYGLHERFLIALLEAGASVEPTEASLPTLLSTNPMDSNTHRRADILMAAGMRLSEGDTQFLTSLKQAKGLKESYKFYVEEVAAGKEPMPTVESLKDKYGIHFDLEKRNQNLARLNGEELPTQEIVVPAKTKNKIKSGGQKLGG